MEVVVTAHRAGLHGWTGGVMVLVCLMVACDGQVDDSDRQDRWEPPAGIFTPVPVIRMPALVFEGEEVALHAGGSRVGQGRYPASVFWKQLAGPTVALQSATQARTRFLAPDVVDNQVIAFELTVTDDVGAVGVARASLIVVDRNSPPQARAGDDRSVGGGEIFDVSANLSSDVDGSIDAVRWREVHGNALRIADPRAAQTQITAPVVRRRRVIALELVVTDNEGRSGSDILLIAVQPVVTALQWSRPPTNRAIRNRPLQPPPEVVLHNADGETIQSGDAAGSSVVLSIAADPPAGGVALGGDTVVAAVGGVARWPTAYFTELGSDVVLVATLQPPSDPPIQIASPEPIIVTWPSPWPAELRSTDVDPALTVRATWAGNVETEFPQASSTAAWVAGTLAIDAALGLDGAQPVQAVRAGDSAAFVVRYERAAWPELHLDLGVPAGSTWLTAMRPGFGIGAQGQANAATPGVVLALAYDAPGFDIDPTPDPAAILSPAHVGGVDSVVWELHGNGNVPWWFALSGSGDVGVHGVELHSVGAASGALDAQETGVETSWAVTVAGRLQGTVATDPCDPTAEAQQEVPTAGGHGFLASFDLHSVTGGCVAPAVRWWAVATGSGSSLISDVAASEPGARLWATGWWQGSADFGSSAAVHMGVLSPDAHSRAPVLWVLDRVDGASVFLRRLIVTGTGNAVAVAAGGADRIYAVGDYAGVLLPDAGEAAVSVGQPSHGGSTDAFVVSYDADGNLRFAVGVGGSGEDRAVSAVSGPDDEGVYVCGVFMESVDFAGRAGDPWIHHAAPSAQTAFVWALDPWGRARWVGTWPHAGGSRCLGLSTAVAANGNTLLLATLSFEGGGEVDLDPADTTVLRTFAPSASSAVVLALDGQGRLVP